MFWGTPRGRTFLAFPTVPPGFTLEQILVMLRPADEVPPPIYRAVPG